MPSNNYVCNVQYRHDYSPLSLAIFGALALMSPTIATAQNADNKVVTVAATVDPATQSIKTVVVTATRTDIDVSDAPAAVTVITRQDIDTRNVSRVTDALQKVPSLYLGRGENGQVNSFEGGFSLRGMSTNRTLVLLDGLQPLQNANSQGVNWLTVFVDDVERVEVVPGAFASLYGSNAMGGVINVIGKRADKDELTARLKRGYGNAGGTDASVYFRQKFSSGFGLIAGLSRVDRDGYTSERTVRTPVAGVAGTAVSGAIATTTRDGTPAFIVGDRGRQPWDQSNNMVKLSYDFSATDRVYLGYATAEAKQLFTRFNTYLTNAATGAAVSSGTLGINGQRITLTESNFVGSTPLVESSKRLFTGYEALVGKEIKFKADFAKIDRNFRFPTVGAAATFDAGLGSLSDSPNASFDATTTLSFPLGAQHYLVAGLSLHRDEVARRGYALSNWRELDSKTTTNNGYNGDSRTSSVFVQDEFTFSNRLTVYSGLRFDRWQTKGDFFQNTAPISVATYASRAKNALNPKISGVFKATDDMTIRASWGQSFRAPSNLDLYSTTVQSSSVSSTGLLTIQSDPTLRPERGNSWEFGGEWRLNQQFKTSATTYQTRLTNMIYSKQITTALTQRINAGESKVTGLEVSAQAKVLPWLELNTNVSFINSKLVSNEADPLSVGKRLTQVPNKTAYVALSANHGAWSGNMEARYLGATFITAQNTDTVAGVPGSNDAHTMVNAKVGYQFNKAVRFNFAMNNVMDKTVYIFAQLPRRNMTAEMVVSF